MDRKRPLEPNGVIQRKLALLDEQVLNLQKHLEGVTLERFRADWVLKSMAERALQIAIEIVIDIAERLIANADAGPVATAAEAMGKCVQLGYLSSQEPYVAMVRFRNFIVHEYERIDADLTYALATQGLRDFRAFRREIDALIAREQ